MFVNNNKNYIDNSHTLKAQWEHKWIQISNVKVTFVGQLPV